MKLSTIVGILTLLAVLAGITVALWQREAVHAPRSGMSTERDLFGAPIVQQEPAELDPDRNADSPGDSAPLPEETHHAAPADAPLEMPDLPGESQPPDAAAEPFMAPEITAYA